MDPRLLSRKTKSTMGGGLNEVAAQQPSMSDFGARMLAKFGWKEGEGLGKKKDGMKEHIRVKQRKDGLGLGADAEPVKSEWAAPELKVVAAKRDGSDSDDSDDEDDAAEAAVRQRIQGSGVIPGMSDADLFKICGGARLGMRARAKQDGKQARMEEADRKLAAQRAAAGKAAAGKSSSTSEADLAAAAVMEAKAKKESKKRSRYEAANGGNAVGGSSSAGAGGTGADKPRASPRLAALAAAKADVPEMSLMDVDDDRAAKKAAKKAKKAEGESDEERAARKAAKKAAKKDKKDKKKDKEKKRD